MIHASRYIKSVCPGDLVGVEIGVYNGVNADDMLQHMNIKKLYLVDPYKGYMGKDGILYPDDMTDVPGEFNDEDAKRKHPVPPKAVSKKTAHEKLEKFKEKIVWIEKFSDDAVSEIPDMLDFAYIDGNHNYEYVKSDLENYYPKLRKGGILSGHDWGDARHPGVTKAVKEFIQKLEDKNKPRLYDLKLQIIDWAIQK